MIQNSENVKFNIWFSNDKTKEEIEDFVETCGCKLLLVKIEDDLNEVKLSFITLYAWKLVMMDRGFHNGAKKISISKL